MYKIQECSKITDLASFTLRYYDAEEILKPIFRDESNHYCYYSDNDYQKAKMIIILKDSYFSIA